MILLVIRRNRMDTQELMKQVIHHFCTLALPSVGENPKLIIRKPFHRDEQFCATTQLVIQYLRIRSDGKRPSSWPHILIPVANVIRSGWRTVSFRKKYSSTNHSFLSFFETIFFPIVPGIPQIIVYPATHQWDALLCHVRHSLHYGFRDATSHGSTQQIE